MYQVRGPLHPQGFPQLQFYSDSLPQAYGVMIECRRISKVKNYHVYTKDSSIKRKKDFIGCTPVDYTNKLSLDDKGSIIFNNESTSLVITSEPETNLTDIIQSELRKNEEIILYNPFNEPFNSGNRNFRSLIGSEIVLEGLIGIGKSTLGRSLNEYLSKSGFQVKYFPEYVDENLLSLYISNMSKYSFLYQCIIARERLRVYDEAKNFSGQGGISIIDRSLIGDVAFATMQKENGFINDTEWKVYNKLIKSDHSEPMVTLYLEGTPELAFKRMIQRNLSAEVSGYTLDYFQKLDYAYQTAFSISKNIGHVIRIPWEDSSFSNDNEFKILDFKVCENVLTTIRDHLNNSN